MANEAGLALQNSETLQRMMDETVAPMRNFFGQNRALAIERERAMINQRNRLAEMAQQHQFAMEEQAKQNEAAMARQQEAERAALGLQGTVLDKTAEREKQMAMLNQQYAVENQVRGEAEKIRGDGNARRYFDKKISDFADTPEGNAALVKAYHDGVAKNGEKVDTEDVVSLTKQSIQMIKSLSNTTAGSPQAKMAMTQFLAQPGVADTFLKKGKFTPEMLQALLASGDPAQVYAAIGKAADNASWVYGRDDKVVANLTGAWMQALADNKALSPEQQIQADQLKSFLMRRDAIFAQGNIASPESLSAITAAAGIKPQTEKPAMDPAQLEAIKRARTAAMTPQASAGLAPQTTPFGQVPVQATGSHFPATLFESNPVQQGIGAARRASPLNFDQGALAFSPQPLAQDPATEYAVRQELLNRHYQNTVAKSAIAEGMRALPLPNFLQPTPPDPMAAAYEQMAKETQLKALVANLYAPQDTPQISPAPEPQISLAPEPQISVAPQQFGPAGPW